MSKTKYLLHSSWVLTAMQKYYPNAHRNGDKTVDGVYSVKVLEDHESIEVIIYEKCIRIKKLLSDSEDWHTIRGEAFIKDLADLLVKVTGKPCCWWELFDHSIILM